MICLIVRDFVLPYRVVDEAVYRGWRRGIQQKWMRQLDSIATLEDYLRRSALRCPNRLYPHYLLMKLYLRQPADSAAARREAKILLTKKEKVPSPAIEEMRKEAKIIMDEGIFN